MRAHTYATPSRKSLDKTRQCQDVCKDNDLTVQWMWHGYRICWLQVQLFSQILITNQTSNKQFASYKVHLLKWPKLLLTHANYKDTYTSLANNADHQPACHPPQQQLPLQPSPHASSVVPPVSSTQL